MSDYKILTHEFEPVFHEQSKILILGTFPSVKSRENNFYYGHPRNRFWQVLSILTEEPLPQTIAAKKLLLQNHNIAIWDVIWQCEIIGSADSSIKNVIPTDLSEMLTYSNIKRIFGNGAKACQLYNKYTFGSTQIPIEKLPSTSPANASYSIEKLLQDWRVILSC